MKTVTQTYRKLKVADLKPHPRNPRRGDLAAIGESLDANGFYGAVIVQKSTGFILAGNHRYTAAVEAGAKTLPAIVVDVDDETAARIMAADNRTGDLAAYDDDALLALLRDIGTSFGSLEGSGYDQDEYRLLEKRLTAPPPEPPPPSPRKGLPTEYQCPNCGHEWAGPRKPVGS